jgi:hypothetical protein
MTRVISSRDTYCGNCAIKTCVIPLKTYGEGQWVVLVKSVTTSRTVDGTSQAPAGARSNENSGSSWPWTRSKCVKQLFIANAIS